MTDFSPYLPKESNTAKTVSSSNVFVRHYRRRGAIKPVLTPFSLLCDSIYNFQIFFFFFNGVETTVCFRSF